jgi:hypothetical protein
MLGWAMAVTVVIYKVYHAGRICSVVRGKIKTLPKHVLGEFCYIVLKHKLRFLEGGKRNL